MDSGFSINTTFFREGSNLLGINDLEKPVEPMATASIDR